MPSRLRFGPAGKPVDLKGADYVKAIEWDGGRVELGKRRILPGDVKRLKAKGFNVEYYDCYEFDGGWRCELILTAPFPFKARIYRYNDYFGWDGEDLVYAWEV